MRVNRLTPLLPRATGLIVLAVLCFAGPMLRAPAHSLDMALAELADDVVICTVDGEPRTHAQLRFLAKIHEVGGEDGPSRVVGLEELIREARMEPTWRALAARAREELAELEPARLETVERQMRASLHDLALRLRVQPRIAPVTFDDLRALYEAREEVYREPERLIYSEVRLPLTHDPMPPPRLVEVHRRLLGGEPFVQVQRSLAENLASSGPQVMSPARPDGPPPGLVDVFHGLERMEISEPFRTDAGWHIIRREFWMREHQKPFNAVMEELIQIDRERKTEAALSAFFRQRWKEHAGARLNLDHLQASREFARPSDPMLTLGEVVMTRGELQAAGGAMFSGVFTISEAGLLERALHCGPVQRALLDDFVRRIKLDTLPLAQFYRSALEDAQWVRQWVATRTDDTDPRSKTRALEEALERHRVPASLEVKLNPWSY